MIQGIIKNCCIISCFVVLLGCSNNKTEELNSALEKNVTQRIQYLNSDIRYGALRDNGYLLSIDLIDSLMSEIRQNDFEEINVELAELGSELGIDLVLCEENNNIETCILLNKLIFLDKLIQLSQSSLNVFGSIYPKVIMERDEANEATYKVILVATDSLFNPRVDLFIRSDTFPIEVTNGQAVFTMQKKDPNTRHNFSGEVIMETRAGIKKLPFTFPSR